MIEDYCVAHVCFFKDLKPEKGKGMVGVNGPCICFDEKLSKGQIIYVKRLKFDLKKSIEVNHELMLSLKTHEHLKNNSKKV